MHNLSFTIALTLVVLVPFVAWFALRRTAWYRSWFVGTADEPSFAAMLVVLGFQIVLAVIALGLVGVVAIAVVLWAWRTVFGT